MSNKYGPGESGDILDDLNSLKVEKQKDAVKKVISAMTVGRDVSKLFPQVVKCIATQDIELKKLVYLYVINYARIKPLETLLAVNSFKKDASDTNPNPLTRALAVRTMGCLGVEQIMQFLCDPLKDALMDKDPYVRKTAAMCVAKIYDINAPLVEEQFGFIEMLQKLLEEETNALVIANCISALIEISTTKGVDIFKINWKKCRHLMNALHENNEWTQIHLLEGIAKYSPRSQDEIQEVTERVLPFVSHSNSGVVLSAIKILVKLLDLVESPDTIRSVCKKITPSLVTLLSAEPEIQYVALKNINILIQKRPIIFEKDIRIFFCNFTEPIYNKLEKLEIIYKLVTMNNVDSVLNELKEYATEVDVQFVRRAVRLIGQCAIKLEKAAQRCVETLVELVKTQVSFVIQESIIALRDIFRRYPNTFEGAMAIVNENLRSLDDSEAKAALIWIIGEYADRIDGAENQLSRFLDAMKEEPYNVQLQILNSAVKTFLKCQTELSFNILNQVFEFTNKESENPDLRERGYMYYRLMAIDPNIASKIVLTEKPRISEDVSGFDVLLLDKLVDNLGTLATIYCKPPELFVKKTKNKFFDEEEEGEYEESAIKIEEEEEQPNKKRNSSTEEESVKESKSTRTHEPAKQEVNLIDINDILGGGINSTVPTTQPSMNTKLQLNQSNIDIMNVFESNSNLINTFSNVSLEKINSIVIPKQVVLAESVPGYANRVSGLAIEASVYRQNNNLSLLISLRNCTNMLIQNFVLQCNKNYFGITMPSDGLKGLALAPGSNEERRIDIIAGPSDSTKTFDINPPYLLQTAIRCTLDEYYFTIPIMLCVLFQPQTQIMNFEEFQVNFSRIQATKESTLIISNVHAKYQSVNSIIERLRSNNIHLTRKNDSPNEVQMFFHALLMNNQSVFIASSYNPSLPNSINIMAKTESYFLVPHIIQSLKYLIASDL